MFGPKSENANIKRFNKVYVSKSDTTTFDQCMTLSTKPLATEGFFANYQNHALAKGVDQAGGKDASTVRTVMDLLVARRDEDEFINIEVVTQLLPLMSGFCTDLMKTKISFMHRLYDRYDYMDSVMQATLIPVVKILLAAVLLITAIITTCFYLYVQCKGLVSDNKTDADIIIEPIYHPRMAALNLALSSCVALATATTDFVNGVAGILIRPVMTAICGYNDIDESLGGEFYRFAYPEYDAIDALRDALEEENPELQSRVTV